MPRIPPSRTHEQQANADRLAVLKVGTPAALRAWAEQYEIPLIRAEDDDLILISIHEARVAEEALPEYLRASSRRWLAANRGRIVAEREAQS
jgi:hypothetical protein